MTLNIFPQGPRNQQDVFWHMLGRSDRFHKQWILQVGQGSVLGVVSEVDLKKLLITVNS